MEKLISILKNKKTFFIGLLIIFLLFVFDIWTKRLAFSNVDYIIEKTAGVHNHIKITSFFNIVKVVNTGVSFGLFSNLEYGQLILSVITFLIIAFLLYLAWKTDDKYKIFIYSIIISGGLGNLYDRIIYGGVFDFLDFHIGDYHWPAFNIADSLICIGVFLFVFDDFIVFLKNSKNKNK